MNLFMRLEKSQTVNHATVSRDSGQGDGGDSRPLCKDMDEINCRHWASLGKCRARPEFMMEKCQKTCNACPKSESREITTTITTTTTTITITVTTTTTTAITITVTVSFTIITTITIIIILLSLSLSPPPSLSPSLSVSLSLPLSLSL